MRDRETERKVWERGGREGEGGGEKEREGGTMKFCPGQIVLRLCGEITG